MTKSMALAKITSKGQITIPKEIRLKLRLKEGDKIFFIEDNGKIQLQSASQVALINLQNGMKEQAKKAKFKSEEDIVNYIKEQRREK